MPVKFTNCGLVMPYGAIDLGRHWLRTNVDLSSVKPCGILMGAISRELLKISILDMSFKIAI